jgi:glycosyltransferase involved in cell wall biosynthesis
MRRAARVVCVADAVRTEVIERLGVVPERASTIPNGVDPARISDQAIEPAAARRRLGLDEGARVILSIAALTWEKDPLAMLEVTAPLLRDDPRTRHVFAGDGPLRATVANRVAELGLQNSVIMLGARKDVGAVFAATDVVLFASTTGGMEGMPATIIEAGLCARPVVAAALAGVREVIDDGDTGILAPPGDLGALRAGVQLLLGDDERRARLGAAARRRCAGHFTIERVAPQYVAVWESVASGSPQ